jgi:endonuclease YncB( thermonuclease family)
MIKNKHHTYINTTHKEQQLSIEATVDGEKRVFNIILPPKRVEADLLTKIKFTEGISKGQKVEITSITALSSEVLPSGEVKVVRQGVGSSAGLSKSEILKKSVLLDIETTGLKGGDIIHQIAVYDPTEKKAQLFIPKPELLIQDKAGAGAGGEQALSRRLGRRLVGKRYDVATHTEGKFASTLIEMIKSKEDVSSFGTEIDLAAKEYADGKVTAHQLTEKILPEVKKADPKVIGGIQDYLIEHDRFQAVLMADEEKLKAAKLGVDARGELTPETIQKRRVFQEISSGRVTVPELMDFVSESSGKSRAEVAEKFSGGLSITKHKTIEQLMKTDLAQTLKGKVTWIANASFEAKEFGVWIDSSAEESLDALNLHRKASNTSLAPVDRKTFFEGFQYGRYEAELDTLNLERTKLGEKNVLTKNPFYGILGGVSATSGDPFYTTDLAYNTLKAKAQKSGDYSGLYEGILRHTKEGDVRDILDLVRAQQSQLINEGVLDQKLPSALSMEVQGRFYGYTEQLELGEDKGLSMSLRSDNAIAALKEAESHAAIGDTAITEDRVLQQSMDQLEAKRIVDQGGVQAQELLRQASQGKGAYFRYQTYGSLVQYFTKSATLADGTTSAGLNELLFKQRIGKSMLDVVDRKALTVRTPKPGMRTVEQASKVGELAVKTKIPVSPKTDQVRLTDLDDIFQHLSELKGYGSVDKARLLEEARTTYGGFFVDGALDESQAAQLRTVAMQNAEVADNVIDTFTRRVDTGQFNEAFLKNITHFIGGQKEPRLSITPKAAPLNVGAPSKSIVPPSVPAGRVPVTTAPVAPQPKIPTSAADSVQNTLDRQAKPSVSKGLRSIAKGHLGKYAILTGALAALSPKTAHEETGGELLAPSYDQFLEAQSQFYGNEESYINTIKQKYGRMEGMQESGLSSMMRKAFTDFGSPYQGPAYTQGVLDDHRLRRERHKYVQQQFGMRHFSEQGDVGFFFKKFISTAFRRQHGLAKDSRTLIFGGARPADMERYGGLRGKDLVERRFGSNFSIDVEDADTISIRRKGNINSPLSDFMGTGKQDSMSIRLAGIDAPETAHQDRRAQPFAEKAKQIATELINRAKDVRVVSRPNDVTYGRQVGVVYVDGKNLNLELVKRGAAAYLPYKSKGKPPVYNQKAFEDAQEFAQDSKRGMWNTGYFQAYKEIVRATGETTTFNTLANVRKVATNANLMSIYSLMNQADRAGGVTGQIMADITQTSERFKASQSKNSRSIFKADSKYSNAHELDLQAFGYNTNSINSTLDIIKSDLGEMIKRRGSKTNEYKLNTKSLRENNYHLVKDTLAAKSVHKEAIIKKQQVNELDKMQKYKRQVMMESLQLAANKNIFNSPIQHHRM